VRRRSRIPAILVVTFSVLIAGAPCRGQDSVSPSISAKPKADAQQSRMAKPPYTGMARRISPVPTVPCFAATSHNYKESACFIEIKRDEPGSPLPVMVPRGTNVEIRVLRRKPLENVQFAQTTDAIPQPDLGLAFVKAFSPGIAAIIGHVHLADVAGPPSDQEKAALTLAEAQQQLNVIADEISCIKKGKEFLESTRNVDRSKKEIEPCGADLADGAAYDNLRFQIINESTPEKLKPLPEADLKALDSEIAAFFTSCWTSTGTDGVNNCLSTALGYQKDQYGLDVALTKLQARQTALAATRAALDALPDAGDFVDDVGSSPDRKATVKISAKDALTGTSVDIATVVITWQSSRFSISGGDNAIEPGQPHVRKHSDHRQRRSQQRLFGQGPHDGHGKRYQAFRSDPTGVF
jgi:hypothetical protein